MQTPKDQKSQAKVYSVPGGAGRIWAMIPLGWGRTTSGAMKSTGPAWESVDCAGNPLITIR